MTRTSTTTAVLSEFHRTIWPGNYPLDDFDKGVAVAGNSNPIALRTVAQFGGHGGYCNVDAKLLNENWPLLLTNRWRYYMAVEDTIIAEQTESIKQAVATYEELVKTFRGAVKNDISSVKASASAIENNLDRMRNVYLGTVAMLTSRDFVLAIENAERLATALKAISDLQSHSITFAVLDKKAAT